MKLFIATFITLLFLSFNSFGQIKKMNIDCYDLKVKKFDYTYAKSATTPGSFVAVRFKVKNIGTKRYETPAATLELYSITGSKRIKLTEWQLNDFDVNVQEEFNWSKQYIPIETLPTQFEAIINYGRFVNLQDCNASNNSRIEDF